MSRYIIESRKITHLVGEIPWVEAISGPAPFVAEVVEGPSWACGTRGYGLTRQTAVADCKAGLPSTNGTDQFIHVEEE